MTETRRPEEGALAFRGWVLLVRGERGNEKEGVLLSTVRVLLSAVDRLEWLTRGGGCTDLALAARDPVVRLLSFIGRDPPSMEERVGSAPVLSDRDAKLGRRLWPVRVVS